jgi:hypothetical protein
MNKTLRVLLLALLPLGLGACREATPEFVPPDAADSRKMSDGLAESMVKSDSNDIYTRLDEGFNTIVSKPADVQRVLNKMYADNGQPLEYKFIISQTAQRVDGPNIRPTRIFWYSVKTTKHPMGKYFIKVEVVKSLYGKHVDVSGFGIMTFEKIPAFLTQN